MKIKNVNWIILIIISLDYTYDITINFQEYNVYNQSINGSPVLGDHNTGILVLYKILKKNHNTGTNFYTSDRQVQEIPINKQNMIISF
jgi:hypothetical protein